MPEMEGGADTGAVLVIGAMSSAAIGAYRAALTRDPCAYCDEPVDVLDHVVARARGGRDTWDNVIGCCAGCNGEKHARSLLAFLLKRRHADLWQFATDIQIYIRRIIGVGL